MPSMLSYCNYMLTKETITLPTQTSSNVFLALLNKEYDCVPRAISRKHPYLLSRGKSVLKFCSWTTGVRTCFTFTMTKLSTSGYLSYVVVKSRTLARWYSKLQIRTS